MLHSGLSNLDVRPGMRVIELSSKTGQGMDLLASSK